MLSKLLKYDLKKMFKVLNMLYIISFITSILTRIFLEIGKNIVFFNIIGKIFMFALNGLVINIIVYSFIRILLRFSLNFYGKESYLTHTLPIDKKTHLASKYIASIIIVFLSVIISLICLLIVYYSPNKMRLLIQSLEATVIDLNISSFCLLFLITLLIFAEIFTIVSIIMLGIVLGNRSNNHKIRNSFIYSIIMYLISIVVMMSAMIIIELLTCNISNLFSNVMTSQVFILLIFTGLFLYITFAIVIYFICQKEFQKGVNVN